MNKLGKKAWMAALVAAQLVVPAAWAGAKIASDDGVKWLSIGVGARASFSSVEDGAASKKDRSSDFDLNNARIYLNGQIHQNVKFELNTECVFCSGDNEEYRILDAIAKFELTPAFNVWAGRLLVPADRAEMSGPFYANVYDGFKTPPYPADKSGSHGTDGAGVYGRDEGIVVWGGLGQEARFTYALGLFEGLEGGSNQEDNLLYSARLSYNFLNVESNPGYYTSSTYYGGAGDVFTVALAYQHQQDGTGTPAVDAVKAKDDMGGDPAVEAKDAVPDNTGDFTGYSIDALYETVLANDGVVTLEAEYKDFDTDGKAGGLKLFEGDAWTATALYLLPNEIGIGKIQPYVRYSDQSPDTGRDTDETEVGFNYIISGHNTRISVLYQNGNLGSKPDEHKDKDTFKIGLQYQY